MTKEKEIEDYLLTLIKNKQIQTSQVEFWRDLAKQDLQKVKTYFKNVKAEETDLVGIENFDFTAEEMEIIKMAGMDLKNPKHLEKTKKYLKGGKK